MHHYRKTRKRYAMLNSGDKAADGCTLCNEVDGLKIVQQNETMFIIHNRVAYDMFEGRQVINHLMIIPKRHRSSIKEFTDQEMLDQMKLISEYEPDGYNVYSRGVGSISRSVTHQHTHLIKLASTKPRFIFFAEKPHILIDR